MTKTYSSEGCADAMVADGYAAEADNLVDNAIIRRLHEDLARAREILADFVDAKARHTSLAEERERMPLIEAAAIAFLAGEAEQPSLCTVCNVLIVSDEIKCGHEGCPLR
jgi:microcompartment protein CcmL/EutN